MTDPGFIPKDSQYDWETPAAFIEAVSQDFGIRFELDAAATIENKKAPAHLEGPCRGVKPCSCGLCYGWDRPTWCNPPYGAVSLRNWTDAAIEAHNRGIQFAFLVPTSTTAERTIKMINAGITLVHVRPRIQFISSVSGDDRMNNRYDNDLWISHSPLFTGQKHIFWNWTTGEGEIYDRSV